MTNKVQIRSSVRTTAFHVSFFGNKSREGKQKTIKQT